MPGHAPRPGRSARVSSDELFGWGAAFGNDGLSVGGLWPDGVLAVGPGFVEEDGSAPPLRAEVPVGYGDEGFQASGVVFPAEAGGRSRARSAGPR